MQFWLIFHLPDLSKCICCNMFKVCLEVSISAVIPDGPSSPTQHPIPIRSKNTHHIRKPQIFAFASHFGKARQD